MFRTSFSSRCGRRSAAGVALAAMLLGACRREPVESEPAGLDWQAADAARDLTLQPGVRVADGFVVEGFAADPLLANPVALDVDDRGRVWIAETHRYQRSVLDITQQPAWLDAELALRSVADRDAFLRRTFAANPELLTADSELLRVLVDDDGDGRADRSAVVAGGFDQPTAGTAAGVLAHGEDVFFACIPSLWKLEGAGRLERPATPVSLQDGFGVHVGVTGHDLHGLILGPEGRLWFTVGDRGAVLETAAGQRIELPDEGAVYRCELDGSKLEVFARGLRNPQELAFDDLGNLFTADNDTAGADRSRVIHVVRGGDYGWRCSYQHQPGFGPWVQEEIWRGSRIDDVLPNAGYGPQGPGGLAFDPGTGFAATERGRFVCCDFPKGLMTFGVEPRGASFAVVEPRFLIEGIWAPDACFGPDGALWIVDWIGGWGQPRAGAVHRLYAAGMLDDPQVGAVRELLGSDFAERAVADLLALLDHVDRRARQRAQGEAVRRVIAGAAALRVGLLEVARDAEKPDRQRLHALLALGAVARAGGMPLEVGFALRDSSSALRVAALRMVADGVVAAAGADLVALLAAADPGVRCAALQALGVTVAAGGAASDLTDLLDGGVSHGIEQDPYLEHALVEALHRGVPASRLAGFADHADVTVRRVAARALRRLASPAVARFLDDRDPAVVSTAVRAIHDVPIPAAMADLADHHDRVPERDRSRALDALRRAGRPQDLQRLVAWAVDPAAAAALRGMALEALASWQRPAVIDPVLGLWRPVDARPAGDGVAARRALGERVEQLFAARSMAGLQEPVVRQAVATVVALELDVAVASLAELALDAERSAKARAAALRGLGHFPVPAELSARLWGAIQGDGAPEALRIAALEALVVAAGAAPSAEQVAWLQGVAKSAGATLAERRAALVAWGALRDPQARADLRELLTAGLDAWPAALHLDVLEANAAAAATAGDADWQRAVAESRSRAGREIYLHGGDAAQGGGIFAGDGRVQCQRCHAVAGVGGNLGPALNAIGDELSGAQLVEALLEPAARIRDGYPPAMPPVAAMLEPTELRDLIAWLQQRRSR